MFTNLFTGLSFVTDLNALSQYSTVESIIQQVPSSESGENNILKNDHDIVQLTTMVDKNEKLKK